MKHSVILEYSHCRGCTTCIKNCPTEAIRVRSGKATILNERCIDCGKCLRVCPHRAIKSISDSLSKMDQYEYRVALPDPALYGQFQNLDDIDVVLNGLLKLGFQKVFETARAAEVLSDYARHCRLHGEEKAAPQISSACPTITRLIRIRFPKLIPNVADTITPVELAAILARREARRETGLPPEKIGVFSIVPCSSQVTAAHTPERLQQPVLDGAFAIRDIYLRLLGPMRELQEVGPMTSTGVIGVGWAVCGGESAALMGERCLAVDGIENCIQMLEEIEDGRLPEADFIELRACTQGCTGGCFTVENPYGARMRIKKLMKDLPMSRNGMDALGAERGLVKADRELQYVPAFLLDQDRSVALEKMIKIETLRRTLPGLDCGSCGAPSCHALAEDVVLGRATVEDCIFKVRERMQYMAGTGDADEYLPAPFRQRKRPVRTYENGRKDGAGK